jgi:hypothetical protein
MSDYVLQLARGPFVGRVDPWAEAPHYFSQLHSGMIAAVLSQIWQPLLEKGYVASKEASLQIADMCKPDIAVQQAELVTRPGLTFDYASAAAEILAEPVLMIETEEPELQAVHLRESGSNRLVTVVEVISPRNKACDPDMARYQQQRSQVFISQGVNVVEIDLTRSVKRLVDHALIWQSAYHIAVHLPTHQTYITPMNVNEPLKRCALPLLDSVLGVELQTAYDVAYREATIAAQLESNGHYVAEHLPFPSLLTAEQQAQALDAVAAWRALLAFLRQG